MSEALMSEVLIMEVGRAAFPPSGAGDFAAGDGGVVLGPMSLIIGKGAINGGGPDGGATWPVRCLLAGGGSDFGATLPSEKVSWYLPGLGTGRVGIGAVGIAFGGGREGGVGNVCAVARIFSRWRTMTGFSHINPAVQRSRRSTIASLGIAHCVVTAKLRLWWTKFSSSFSFCRASRARATKSVGFFCTRTRAPAQAILVLLKAYWASNKWLWALVSLVLARLARVKASTAFSICPNCMWARPARSKPMELVPKHLAAR